MNYQSLFSTLFTVAHNLGFTPTTSSSLHDTLLDAGFPIASFLPIVMTSLEGEKEPRRGYEFEVKFMCDNVLGSAMRQERISNLMSQAERFMAGLRGCGGILEVELLSLVPEEHILTLAGECAVTLKARVVTIECGN